MMTEAEKLKLAKEAIKHVLGAIADDPRKYWLMGDGTGSWSKLTEAAAAIWNEPVEGIRSTFKPDKAAYDPLKQVVDSLSLRMTNHRRERGMIMAVQQVNRALVQTLGHQHVITSRFKLFSSVFFHSN
jgi:hypothetical protein